MSNLLENIKRIADLQNISIHKLEQVANLANGTISKWETSKPSLESVIKVSNALGTTVDELLKE